MNGYDGLELRAQEAVRIFFQQLFDGSDADTVTAMLHKDVVWMDMPSRKTYRSKEKVSKFLAQKMISLQEIYRIRNLRTEALLFDEQHCSVSCEIGLTQLITFEHTEKTLVVSLTCVEEEGKILLQYVQICLMRTEMDIDSLPAAVMICSYDERLTLHYVNHGFSAITGYSEEEADHAYASLIHPADRQAVLRSVSAQLKETGQFAVDYRLVRRDGDVIWVHHRGLLKEYNSGYRELRCVLADVTDQKHQQEELRLSEKRYAVVMEASGISTFDFDIRTGQIFLPLGISLLYGFPMIVEDGVETFIRHGVVEACSADDFRNLYQRMRDGEPFAKSYIKVRDAKGKKSDYEISLTCVYDDEGKPIRAIGARRNVSQMVDLQREKEYGMNLASGQILIFEADITNDRVEYMNEKWRIALKENGDLSYSQVIGHMSDTYIMPEHKLLFQNRMSAEYIEEVSQKGENLISFDYKRRGEAVPYIWYKAIMNIVRDARTGILSIRFYHKDIDRDKRREEQIQEERRLYESITAKAELVYEVNITKNQLITGHENWKEMYGIDVVDDYTEMIHRFARKAIYPEDMGIFLQALDREHVLECYSAGEHKIVCQYRRPDKKNQCYWYNCILHLFEDANNKDVKGFAYIEDIDKQKRMELLLKYNAEHDTTTGIYNKGTLEHKITEYLATPGGRQGRHAFFIIDIDYFKDINDNYGHLFGDEVIREVAEKIRSLFRENDVVGRIGGDEFCVFMKHVNVSGIVELKARELCETLHLTYMFHGVECELSASVGISIYHGDGAAYEELYKSADELLYEAKHEGRNRYIIEQDGSI